MKKTMFNTINIIFLALALFAVSAFAAPVDKGQQGRDRQLGKRRLQNSDWIKYIPDPAFSYGIKAQKQRCTLIEETCIVLETYWLNGSDDVDRCNVTPVAIANEVNVYANLEHANNVMRRCNNRPEYANIQYVFDGNHDGINEVSQFFRWTFSVVRQDK